MFAWNRETETYRGRNIQHTTELEGKEKIIVVERCQRQCQRSETDFDKVLESCDSLFFRCFQQSMKIMGLDISRKKSTKYPSLRSHENTLWCCCH